MRAVTELEALGDRLVGRWPADGLGPDDPASGALAAEPARVLRGLIKVAVVLVVLQSVLHLVDVAAFDLRIGRLDLERDASVWSWAGSAAQLTAALGAALLVVVAPTRWKVVAFLALVFTFLSMDDTVRIHERLSHVFDRFGTPIPRRMLWPAFYAPLMLVTSVLLWRLSGAMVEACRRAARAGLVLLGGAVVLEFAVATLLISLGYGRVGVSRMGSLAYELEVVVEEGLELAGWLLVGAALLATGLELLVRRARREGKAGTQLSP